MRHHIFTKGLKEVITEVPGTVEKQVAGINQINQRKRYELQTINFKDYTKQKVFKNNKKAAARKNNRNFLRVNFGVYSGGHGN